MFNNNFLNSIIYYLKFLYDTALKYLQKIDWTNIMASLISEKKLFVILILLFILVLWLLVRYFRTTSIRVDADESPKNLAKSAKALCGKGENLLAANLYQKAGMLKEAAECYLKANAPLRAAEIYLADNDLVNAAKNFEKARQYEKAANLYLKASMPKNAAENIEKTGNLKSAAEFYERAGDFERAGEFYHRSGLLKKASDMFRNSGQWEKAGAMIELIINNAPASSLSSIPDAETKNLSLSGAEYYKKAGKLANAADLQLKAGMLADAAALYSSAGRFREAAELYVKTENYTSATQAFEKAGMLKEAVLLKAKYHTQKGEDMEAARLYENSGEFKTAAEIYEKMNNFRKSAELHFKSGDNEKAALFFEKANDLSLSAESYEKAGNFVKAAEMYSKAGNPKKEIECFEKANKLLPLAKKLKEQGSTERAIGILQKIPASSQDYYHASLALAEIFKDKGEVSLAIGKYNDALSGKKVSEENLAYFYDFGTLLEKTGKQKEAHQTYEDILKVQYHYKDAAQRIRNIQDKMTAEPAPNAEMETLYAETKYTVKEKPASKKKYEIVGEIGRGAMGVVYKAKDTILQRTVALKVMPKILVDNPAITQNFLKEARAAAQLNHPNIVIIYEAGEEEGDLFIAMEFIDGSNLKQMLIKKKPIALQGVLFISAQICKGIAYAHENKIVHRDIKPTNIMWTPKKVIKILDFGLAKVVQEMASTVTIVGGTPYYMSPEQTLGEKIDHRSDIYSLGVTMFEIATGILPFSKGDVGYHHIHTPPPDPRQLNHEISEQLSKIILKCLAKDPSDRYKSAYDVFEELKLIKI